MLSEVELRTTGFSRRAASVRAQLGTVRSLDELREAEWGGVKFEDRGLHRDLILAPNCGQRVISEVRAFREHGDPRHPLADNPPAVSVQFSSDELGAVDAWIADQDEPMTGPKL